MFIAVWVLFLLAGLLLGGAWSAYQSENKLLTVGAVLMATLTFIAAMVWLISEVRG